MINSTLIVKGRRTGLTYTALNMDIAISGISFSPINLANGCKISQVSSKTNNAFRPGNNPGRRGKFKPSRHRK